MMHKRIAIYLFYFMLLLLLCVFKNYVGLQGFITAHLNIQEFNKEKRLVENCLI